MSSFQTLTHKHSFHPQEDIKKIILSLLTKTPRPFGLFPVFWHFFWMTSLIVVLYVPDNPPRVKGLVTEILHECREKMKQLNCFDGYKGWMKPNSNITSQGLGSLLHWAIFSVKKLDLHTIQLKGGPALKYWSAFFDTLVSWLPWTRE